MVYKFEEIACSAPKPTTLIFSGLQLFFAIGMSATETHLVEPTQVRMPDAGMGDSAKEYQ